MSARPVRPMRGIRRWVAGLLAACLLLAGGAAALAQPLRLAVARGPVSLSVYVAETQGLFAREGVEVRTRSCHSGRQCLQWLAEDGADLATTSEFAVALQAAARPDFAILTTLSTSSRQIKLVARYSAGIARPAQLRGKRVGTPLGTSAHYFLSSWLLFHDIDPASLTIVPLPPEALAEAMRRREIDAAAIWEPLADEIRLALSDEAQVLPNPRVYTQHFVLAARQPLLAPRDADLQRLLRALLRAQRMIEDDPALAARILAERLGIEPASAALQLKEHDYRLRLDQTLLSTMGNQMRWAVREGYAASALRDASPVKLVEPGLLRRLAPGSVTLAF